MLKTKYPRVDFIVDYDEDPAVLGQRVLQNIVLSRVRARKNTLILITGKSREGKSMLAMKWFELLCAKKGWLPQDYLGDVLIFGAKDYMETVKKLLPPFEQNDKFRRFNIMWLDEGRYIIDASNWNDLMVRSIGHVNTTVGALKPMIMFVVAQSTFDVAKRIRRSFDFYVKVERPLSGNANARISRLYENDIDLQNVYFGKAKLRGFVRMPDGRRKFIKPRNFSVSLPSQKLRDVYEKVEGERKGEFIEALLSDMARKEEASNSDILKRVNEIVEVHSKGDKYLELYNTKRGRRVLRPELKTLYNLSTYEMKRLPAILDKKLAERGIVIDHGKE